MDSSSLKPGLAYEFKFKIPENKTVPFLYPESPEFQVMPKVFATGFMVGLLGNSYFIAKAIPISIKLHLS